MGTSKDHAEEYSFAIQQHEDAALKASMQFFAEEILPYLGIEGRVVGLAPTELIHLELKKLYQDLNLVMEDSSWKHFEFQSTDEGIEGLKRFRTYEALASYQYGVEITTYVLYSGKIKNPATEFTEGINTYRVHPIIMQHMDADELIRDIQEKTLSGKKLTKQDLVPLTLCLLMGGQMSQKERVKAAFSITQKAAGTEPQIIQKIEAVVYLMAEKFLESVDMEEIMEAVKMTRLGQMLMEEGMSRGIKEGMNRGIEQNQLEVARNLIGLLDENLIAERVGLSLEKVLELKKELQEQTMR